MIAWMRAHEGAVIMMIAVAYLLLTIGAGWFIAVCWPSEMWTMIPAGGLALFILGSAVSYVMEFGWKS